MGDDTGREQEHGFGELDKVEEMKSLGRVLDAYMDYRISIEDDIIRWERSFHRLTPSHRNLVPELPAKYAALRRCADQNARLIHTMLQAFDMPFQVNDSEFHNPERLQEGRFQSGAGATANSSLPVRGEFTPQAALVETPDDSQFEETRQSRQKRSRLGVSGAEGTAQRATTLSSANQSLPGVCRSGSVSKDVDLGPWEASADGKGNQIQAREPVHTVDERELVHTVDDREPLHSVDKQEPLHTRNGIAAQGAVEPDRREPFFTRGHGQAGQGMVEPVHTDGGAKANGGGEPVHTQANGATHAWGSDQAGAHFHRQVPPGDVEKVRCVLRNIVRDWTSEGAIERSECYGPILSELRSCFPNRNPANPPSCVVPGAGLARLACEIARLGFECQGNEFSYYTLIVSSFILNMTDRADEWLFYPYIHSQCNARRDVDIMRPVTLPDLHPGSAGIADGFSMCAGEFLEVYGGAQQAGAWDSVVTCFFIDTAHNVIAYLEVISRILKPGGVWINFGPLLYHFADAHQYSGDDELSVELSLETVLRVAQSFGLTLKRDPQFVSTSYTSNPRSMMTTRYQCAFWTMVKSGAAEQQP